MFLGARKLVKRTGRGGVGGGWLGGKPRQRGVRPNRVDTRPKPHGLPVARDAAHGGHAAEKAIVAVAVAGQH